MKWDDDGWRHEKLLMFDTIINFVQQFSDEFSIIRTDEISTKQLCDFIDEKHTSIGMEMKFKEQNLSDY